jgi:sugar phosphate permease
VKARGFSVPEMAELGGMIYLVYATSALVVGWLSDLWIQAGASANRVRKTFVVASHGGVALAMAGCAMGNTAVAVASLFLAGVFFGLNTPNIYAIGQTLAGPRAAGKWIGVQNCIGNIAGIVAPIVTGMVIDRTGQFFWAFVVAGTIALAGCVAWGIVIRRISLVDWNSVEAG